MNTMDLGKSVRKNIVFAYKLYITSFDTIIKKMNTNIRFW